MANTLDSKDMRDLFRRWGVNAKVVDAFARRAVGGVAFLRLSERELATEFGADDEHVRNKLLRLQVRLARDPVGFVGEVPRHHRRAAAKLDHFYQRHGVAAKAGKAQSIVDSYCDSPQLLVDTFRKKYPQRARELDFLEEWAQECRRERGRREEFARQLDSFLQRTDPPAAGRGLHVIEQWSDAPRALHAALVAKYGEGSRPGLQWLLAWAEDAEGAAARSLDAVSEGSWRPLSHDSPPASPASGRGARTASPGGCKTKPRPRRTCGGGIGSAARSRGCATRASGTRSALPGQQKTTPIGWRARPRLAC
eukprot:TRINITY_DN16251_c1_g1_i1.p3 TRINITY_DN16251_c1_g1~~TRINITY_DN16251_c1_g1_i1.p3  ORF type:complete len:346 (+),score=92.61 TRINITY_DN16251_c1_g1_i1:112-1038(+)